MPEHVEQADLVGAILKHLGDQGIQTVEARHINAVIDAANKIQAEFARDSVEAAPGMGLDAWLGSDDTGLSSRFMAHVLCGKPIQAENHHPHDPDDFGRCHRFLLACPGAMTNLEAMRQHGPVWFTYVEHWQEMTELYLDELPTGSFRILYQLMARLQREATS